MIMRSLLQFVVVVLLTSQALTQTSSAQTASSNDGFYLGLVGGVQFFDGIEAGDNSDIDYDPGYAVGGQVGYRLGQLRAEAELAYESAELEDAGGDKFDTNIIRGAASLFFDVTDIGSVTPYFGGGIGIANIEIKGTGGNSFEDDKTGVTLHGEAGLAFNVTSNIAIVPHYRLEFFDTKEVANVQNDLYAHAVRVSGRLYF